ncbi:MAG: 1-acyl-sn-glycerol-3-phosphate acyltransferase [Alphaproteobacteria bacterium]|nr:1-acyl-sn-glycerol-3-phosphate acyltransferase [Alphaproteobacteria bacterium]
MKRAYIRSTLFNLCFYVIVAIMCCVMLPTLVLPRKAFYFTIYTFLYTVGFLERNVLGLHYEVRGQEYLPKDGSYILAAKHQSAYETMKLHILFKDPSVILKRELLRIPLWGIYLKKSGPIAIDRSSPDAAIASIQDGARRIKEEGRPIIIFPQGTRVNTDATTTEKPYKVGVARIQEATDLPIIPMALNTGMFWPRNSWFKSSGTVIFEFLPPIEPGLSREELLKKLEETIEPASISLMNEAREKQSKTKHGLKSAILSVLAVFTIMFAAYSALWFYVADEIKRQYPLALADLMEPNVQPQTPVITGFPGKIRMAVDQERLVTPVANIDVQTIRAHGWPIPNSPITLTTGPITARSNRWDDPLEFDSLMAVVNTDGQILNVDESELVYEDAMAALKGTLDLKQEPVPAPDMVITLKNHKSILDKLVSNQILDQRTASFTEGALMFFVNQEGDVEVPLTQKERTVMLGPIPLIVIPNKIEEAPRRRPIPLETLQNPSGASLSGSDTPQDPSP